MDAIDASSSSQFKAVVTMAEAAAERALRRKGQRVNDHPPRERLIGEFMLSICMSRLRVSSTSNTVISTTQAPEPYWPCSRPVNELQSVRIADLELETHHREKMIMLRVCSPPLRMTALMAIVEDEQGTAILLQLYFQPAEATVPVEEIVRPGMVCIVKEPFFKCSTDGRYSVRVDHVGDILWLGRDDERIPANWRGPGSASINNSLGYRTWGNDAVKCQKWARAHRLYSYAIEVAETPAEERLARLNRSFASLNLGQPERALSDAIMCSDSAILSEKQLFREARAAYELRRFDHCRDTLEKLIKSYPENLDAKRELSRALARVREQQTGDFAFGSMYKQTKQTPPMVDCATFSALVEIRTSPGRGRGLFTKGPVSAGQLLLCEKAFAYSYAGSGGSGRELNILMNLSIKTATAGGQANLLTHIVQTLYHNPELSQGFRDLYHGDYVAGPILTTDGFPVVDSFLVERTIALNSFGAPLTSLASLSESLENAAKNAAETVSKERSSAFGTCGIWLLASRINHSCIGNCQRSFIGDMQIVRANKDLKAGTELVFPYQQPKPFDSYEEAQKRLSGWGFCCDCNLCRDKKATSGSTILKRQSIRRGLLKAVNGRANVNVAKMRQLLNQMEETYPSPSSLRLELWESQLLLGAQQLAAGKLDDAIILTVKGLEALGFGIVAYPPIGSGSKQQLKVKQWGQVNDHTPWAFANLFYAYKILAPELCATAKAYVETSYSIVVGEKETVWDTMSDLV